MIECVNKITKVFIFFLINEFIENTTFDIN